MAFDWKEAARWYRARFILSQRTIDQRTALAAAEHEARVALVNAMSDLLPRMMEGGSGRCCKACWSLHGEHTDDCAYLAALRAVAQAGRSPS